MMLIPAVEGKRACSYAVWSPKGSQIAICEEDYTRTNIGEHHLVLTTAQGSARRILVDFIEAHSPVWSPDGRFILVSQITNMPKPVQMGTPASAERSAQEEWVRRARPLAEEYHKALRSAPHRLVIVEAASGKITGITPILSSKINFDSSMSWPSAIQALSSKINYSEDRPWSPDGKALVYCSPSAGGGTDVYLKPLNDSPAQKLTSEPPGSKNILATFSPDGKAIAFVNQTGQEVRIWVMARDGTNKQCVAKTKGTILALAWRPSLQD
jgi:Tol biopolymer transport system component